MAVSALIVLAQGPTNRALLAPLNKTIFTPFVFLVFYYLLLLRHQKPRGAETYSVFGCRETDKLETDCVQYSVTDHSLPRF